MPLFIILAAMTLQTGADAAPAEWAWLNIPDREGPGARFAYDTAVRRDGQRVEVHLRYVADYSPPSDPHPVSVDERIVLDCGARTTQILEQRSLTPGMGLLYNNLVEPVAPNTREAVLIGLLCPAAPRPAPATGAG
jgi:hypothetical protein